MATYNGTANNDTYNGTSDDDTISGLGGNDILYGSYGDDTIDGGIGNDTLCGGSGNDTYFYGIGYGNDTITDYDTNSGILWDGGIDQVIFTGLSQSAIKFQKNNNGLDLTATITATNETLTIIYCFDPILIWQVESFVFTDGTLSLAQINDQINIGNADNETLWGTIGIDTLDGKGGNDTLYGGYGNDTYVFGIGYGNDTVAEQSPNSTFYYGGTDQVVFNGLAKNAVKFEKSNNGMDLTATIIATNEILTISNGFNPDPGYQVESFIFTDGTITLAQIKNPINIGNSDNETLWGTAGDDTLDGKGGNDTLNGGYGNDTYVFGIGYGNDIIAEYDDDMGSLGYGGTDKVTLTGLLQSAVKLNKTNRGWDLQVTIIATNESLTISHGFYPYTDFQVESLVFSDGTLTLAQINTLSNIGGAGDETLWGTTGKDTLDGKGGNDTLYGGDGNDTYVFSTGYGNDTVFEKNDVFNYGGGDKIAFTGLNQSAVKFQKTNNGLDLQAIIITTNETLTINDGFNRFTDYNVEAFEFTDGTLTLAQINILSNIGGAGNETLWGRQGNDTLDGKSGNDSLYGGSGNDTYIFSTGYGDDTVTEYNPNNSVFYYGGTDRVVFTGLTKNAVKFEKTNNGVNLKATIIATNETLTINEGFNWYTSYQVESFVFTDGTLNLSQINAQLNIGSASNETLLGWAEDDILDGKGGNDNLYGGQGNDTYVFGRGYGNDTISEYKIINGSSNSGGFDRLKLIDFNLTDLISFTQSGKNLIIAFSNSNKVTIQNQLSENSTNAIEYFQFANGDVLTKLVFGDSSNNYLTGSVYNDALNGLAGADKMAGGMGNDLYVVNNSGDVVTEAIGAGTDTVLSSINYTLTTNVENLVLSGITALNGIGNNLNNHITGNNGNNNLYGKAGADVMVGGKGNDTYSVENIGDSIIELSNEGTDKVTSSITWTLGANLENLSLSGTKAINGIGNGLNNIINGNAAANNLFGDAGADSLTGGNGRDTLAGGIGKDKLYLAETVAVTDTVKITTGDSKWNGYDEVANFALGKGVTNTAADLLDLDTIKIAANTTAINGVDKGIIKSHSISNGLITFDDMDSFAASLALSASNLTDVFGYLQNNIKSGNTVAFNAIGNTYVFQDGGLIDTVVQLTGVTASNINTTGLVADGVWLV